MKWLLIFALGLLGCGDDPPPTVSSGGDRVPTGSSGGTGATGGAGGGGGEAGAGGAGGAAPKGACDNGTDLDAIEGASESIRNIARDCGLFVCAASVGNSNAYGLCVEDCVNARVTGPLDGLCRLLRQLGALRAGRAVSVSVPGEHLQCPMPRLSERRELHHGLRAVPGTPRRQLRLIRRKHRR